MTVIRSKLLQLKINDFDRLVELRARMVEGSPRKMERQVKIFYNLIHNSTENFLKKGEFQPRLAISMYRLLYDLLYDFPKH